MLKNFFRIMVSVAIGISIALLIRMFIGERYIVPTGSMEPTIEINDCVVGEKVTYRFSDIKVGDIVTFMSPDTPGMILVKRVIATGGSVVDIRDGKVYVDGVESTYGYGKTEELYNNRGITYPYTIPVGSIWCMGDNREHSADARVFGPIPEESVQARIFCIMFPRSRATWF